MSNLLFWVGVGAIILIGAIAIEAYLRRNRPKRSLAETFGAQDETDKLPDLGTEAIDMDQFDAEMQMNRTIDQRPRVKKRGVKKPKPNKE